jgi:hypothetical protein
MVNWKNALSFPPSHSKVALSVVGAKSVGNLVGWFKTAKHRFGLDRFGQATLLGVYRWLVLSLLAYLLAHWAYLSTATIELPDWGQAARLALEALLPHLVMLLLLDLERLQPLARSLGFDIQITRCKI